ncbi:class I SAM-dependent methyltransferase [Paenibacillus alginolyticus]|uniref:Class I SAM-dependent methyltransferase n=1 Tax=Paenibacillus alginolyticus TaxID=59839 RepID=A0ABT4GDV5_9BACL|nr:class I SAM-dependent methyltransferase [Paenibacillus alginolyticus]MCY9694372.1 class I SAM-dependent methyltransferase [Paenibacillus alginolyticus]MEC0147541.1 class I SAM-dependent methyltransferase [Paenibacillus alginolyticus]
MMTYWDNVNPDDFLQTDEEGYNKSIRKLYRDLIGSLQIQSILEVGCGPGVDYVGAVQTRPGIDYTGVDITPQMIEHCQRLYPYGKFVLADIYSLPFANNNFELVYCKDVLNHLEEWEKGFEELYRVSNKYILVNFFYGLGSTTMKEKQDHGTHVNNWYDWNEVMTKLVACHPLSLVVFPRVCNSFEETLILLQKV